MNQNIVIKSLIVWLISFSLLSVTNPIYAGDKTMNEPSKKPNITESVQSKVKSVTEAKTSENRKKIIDEAVAALSETKNALAALDAKKKEEAIAALEKVVGQLEVIIAREPELAFAPIDVRVTTHDLYASLKTIEIAKKEAEELLEKGEVQKARILLQGLASEIVISVANLPLATYPDTIKAVIPLIDKDKFDEAKVALQAALDTVVVINHVIALPVIRAEHLLREAEKLAETEKRSDKDNKVLSNLLENAEHQLKIAAALGYGDQKQYKNFYQQIEEIQKKTDNGKSGKGFFDKVKHSLSNFIHNHF
jgi:hypothetical protein